jgi:hypothetical protein
MYVAYGKISLKFFAQSEALNVYSKGANILTFNNVDSLVRKCYHHYRTLISVQIARFLKKGRI